MKWAPRHILKRLPALVLLLILLSGWLAQPLTLAAPEPITCGMVCCEESGECCCFLSRQAHEHEEGDEHDEAQFVAFQKGCAPDCATPPSSSQLTFQQKSSSSLLRLETVAQDQLPSHQLPPTQRSELSRKSAPRAPPVFS
jgi:hypothetical protein